MAKLYGVSVGPGDFELMTLKAVSVLKKVNYIMVPRTKGDKTMALDIIREVIDLSEKEIEYIDFPMSAGNKEIFNENYDRIAGKILEKLKNEEDVAVINIGDISIFSTFSYISQRVECAGYNVEWIPGVSSFQAVASTIQVPIVQGKESVLIISGDSDDFDKLKDLPVNKVIMKSSRAIESVLDMSAAVIKGVENCGLDTQKIYESKEDLKYGCGYFTTLICKDGDKC